MEHLGARRPYLARGGQLPPLHLAQVAPGLDRDRSPPGRECRPVSGATHRPS